MQTRNGFFRSRIAIRKQTLPMSLPGALRRTSDAPWASASGPTNDSAELPVGVPASVSSTTLAASVSRAPVSASSLKIRTGMVGGRRSGAADHRGARVVGDRAEVVADGGELVGRAGVVARVGVGDHRVDVGVLQQQRAQARVLERVAEAPHAVAVDVGDRPDRADGEVARGVADAHRRARPRRGGGERVERQRGGDEHLAAAPGERAPARASRAAIPPLRPETVSGSASGSTRPTRDWRAIGFPRGASGGLERISSIGVASTVLPPYSPIASEIAPAFFPSQ